jgi:RNA polymerase sigma-70 factor (ECF subfamily)
MEHQSHDFTDLVTGHQQRMYRYIVSLLGHADAAWDVLQETNRVLLEKRNEFEAGTNFVNWALTVAQFQTMAWLRNLKRDRLIATPDIIELIADDAQEMNVGEDSKLRALQACLESLSDHHRDLVHRRYARSEKLSDLSERTGRTVNAMKQLFFRIRETLMNCIQHRLEGESP